MYSFCAVFVVVFLFSGRNEAKFSFAEKSVVIGEVTKCNMMGDWFFIGTTRKFNRTTHIFSFNTTILEDISDDKLMEIELQRWSDSGWKRNFIHYEKGFGCSSLFFVLHDVVASLLSNMGRKVSCPIEKGTVYVKEALLDASSSPLAITLGKFKFLAAFKNSKTKKTFFCIEAVVDINEV